LDYPPCSFANQPAKRIVVLEFSLLDDLLTLGVKPIGFASSQVSEGENPPFLAPQLKNMTDVGTRQQPNLEKIMALHPDLIVTDTTMQGAFYPQLNKIAPTLMLNGLMGDPKTQIENLYALAKATGSQTQVKTIAQKLLAQYTQAHPASVIIGYANDEGQFQMLTANALTSKILRDFSHPNLTTLSRQEQSTPTPIETILAEDPDSIIILLTDDRREPYHALIKNPLWPELRAVKTKHVYFMDRDIGAKNHGILATELLIKQAEDSGFLTNKINKNSGSTQ
jgi:iron complex transport system substrate-binding protein